MSLVSGCDDAPGKIMYHRGSLFTIITSASGSGVLAPDMRCLCHLIIHVVQDTQDRPRYVCPWSFRSSSKTDPKALAISPFIPALWRLTWITPSFPANALIDLACIRSTNSPSRSDSLSKTGASFLRSEIYSPNHQTIILNGDRQQFAQRQSPVANHLDPLIMSTL